MGGKGSGRKRSGGIIPGDTMLRIRPRQIVKRGNHGARPTHALPEKSDLLSREGPGISKTRERMQKALVMKRAGFTYRRIAEELGYKNESGAYEAVKKMLTYTGKLELENMIALHIERTESYLLSLDTRIKKGDPRAVEVATKVLERQATMLGLDYEDRKQQTGPQATVQINILADPRDPDAVRFLDEIRERQAGDSDAGQAVLEGEAIRRSLPPPAEGDSQH